MSSNAAFCVSKYLIVSRDEQDPKRQSKRILRDSRISYLGKDSQFVDDHLRVHEESKVLINESE